MVDGKGTETTMVEFIGWASSFDISTQKPYQLIRLILRSVKNFLIIVFGLAVLRVLKFCTELFMQAVKTICEIGGGRNSGSFGKLGGKSGMICEIGEEGSLVS